MEATKMSGLYVSTRERWGVLGLNILFPSVILEPILTSLANIYLCCKEVAEKSTHEFNGAWGKLTNLYGWVWAQFAWPGSQFPHGNLFYIIPIPLWNNQRWFYNLWCIPNTESCRNQNLQRTHILKCPKHSEIHVRSEIQWGIHIYKPWGEIESARIPKIHWEIQIWKPKSVI